MFLSERVCPPSPCGERRPLRKWLLDRSFPFRPNAVIGNWQDTRKRTYSISAKGQKRTFANFLFAPEAAIVLSQQSSSERNGLSVQANTRPVSCGESVSRTWKRWNALSSGVKGAGLLSEERKGAEGCW
jgi:hypothetical protein